MLGLYDLLAADVPEVAVSAWLQGHDLADMMRGTGVDLPRLSPRERRALSDAWWFWARPGQAWAPGREFITDYQAGRGWGKDRSISETICGPVVAGDPERWGGYAIVVGPDPTQVKRDCLFGPSGIFTAAERASKSGNGPGIVDRNLVDRWLRFEAPRGGGATGGLTVYWAASSDPKSVHGANVGLVWWDEFGVSYHAKYDQQGNNAWQALLPAVRLGDDPKVIITQTPSRAPEVRALQADAERPECPTCRDRMTGGGSTPYRGEALREPWRLPRSDQPRLHPLLNTRTTVVERTCPLCQSAVVARVRSVFGDTRDNPSIAAAARDRAAAELASGQSHAFLRFAPRGEVDSSATGALVRHEHIEQIPYEAPSPAGGRGPLPDRWMLALDALGIDDVVVFVDPAVTSADSSDETGVVAAGSRTRRRRPEDEHDRRVQVVGLQDWSVRPDEVEGAPSLVWAPRAYWLALWWGARRIVVETNQGGDEALTAVRDLVARPPSEAAVMARLREDHPGEHDARLGALARRIAADARRVKVESVRRRADKRARFEWYGRTASPPLSQQAVLCASWTDGAAGWATTTAQLTGYEPPRTAGPQGRPRKDRADALVAAAQVLLGVAETAHDEVEDTPWLGWVARMSAARR